MLRKCFLAVNFLAQYNPYFIELEKNPVLRILATCLHIAST